MHSKCNGKPSQAVSGGNACSSTAHQMKPGCDENEPAEGLVREEWTKELVKPYSSFEVQVRQKQQEAGRDRAANVGASVFLS